MSEELNAGEGAEPVPGAGGAEGAENAPANGAEGADGGRTPSIAEGGGPEQQVVHADYPEDWRQRMASAFAGKAEGDVYEKELKRLGRFKNPENVYRSAREVEQKLSTMKAADPFPAEGTDEEKAAWREANGRPKDPAGYLDDMKELVVGDVDKPYLDDFLNTAHASGWPKEQVAEGVNWYFSNQEKIAAEMEQRDSEYRSQAVEILREEMGGDFKANMSDLKAWLETEGVADAMFDARTADGIRFGDDPKLLSFLTKIMREQNPLETLVPAGTADAAATVEAEIEQLRNIQRTDPDKYWADKKMQERFHKLLDAQERHKAA